MLKRPLDKRHEASDVVHIGFVQGPRADGDHHGLHLRAWPERGRGDDHQWRHLGERLHDDRDRAVGVCAGLGGKPLADLLLNRAREPLEYGPGQQQIDQQRGGDLVGQVRDQFVRAAVLGRPFSEDSEHQRVDAVLAAQRIALDQGEARMIAESIAQQGLQAVIDLDRHHAHAGLEQQLGQRAGAGPDLEDCVGRRQLSRRDELAHQIEIDEEVLPEPVSRGEPRLSEQAPNLRLGLPGHGNVDRPAIGAVRQPGAGGALHVGQTPADARALSWRLAALPLRFVHGLAPEIRRSRFDTGEVFARADLA